jgi:hypothetical protein
VESPQIYVSALRAVLPTQWVIILPKSARNGEFVAKSTLICAESRQIHACFVVQHTMEIT